MSSDQIPTVRLLTRLFIRRILDNDLISPHADRHDSLAVLYAVVVSLAVFVTFFVSIPYLSAFIQLPGVTALSALPDRFLFIAASMAICAVAALFVWDALALEPRDAGILGPLPIPPGTITRAKLLAALVFGVVFAVAVNAVPSVLYPIFLTLNLRGIGAGGTLRLITAQATTVIMAGLFGFSSVLAVRGVLRLAFGERGFRRVSSVAQSVLVVAVLTAIIRTPTVGGEAVRDSMAGVVPPRWPTIPVLWHLGANETFAGNVMVETPLVMPRRLMLPSWLRREDEENRSKYRALQPHFKTYARRAWLVLPVIPSLAIVMFLWNNRRLPEHSVAVGSPSRIRARMRTIAEQLTQGDPEAQAGFFFTFQTLTRSAPHRMIVAVAVAAALTLPFVMLILGRAYAQGLTSSIPLGFFGMQITVLMSLIAGVRYAVAVPAELAANWTIRMAWEGNERAYLAGVKRAATLLAVFLPLLILLPFDVAILGLLPAIAHSGIGCLFAVAALDFVFLGYRRMPFACSYLPLGDPKVLWSGGAAILLLVPYVFAFVERAALQSWTGTATLTATLVGAVITIKFVDQARRREPRPLNFDERPAPPTQRLGVFERMAIQD
jgi:hypothetical protein